MTEASPAVRALAERVVRCETGASATSEALARQLESVFSRLQDVTAGVIGELGYLALTDRAVRLARCRFPWLPPACDEVVRRFPRTHWEPAISTAGPEAARECATELFAGVLALIASFIGEDFTFRLARRAWGDDTVGLDGPESGEA